MGLAWDWDSQVNGVIKVLSREDQDRGPEPLPVEATPKPSLGTELCYRQRRQPAMRPLSPELA